MNTIKLILILAAIVCLLSVISFAYGKIDNNLINNGHIVIYTSEKKDSGSDSFYGYVIENGELNINFWFSTGGEGTSVVFKYADGKLVDMKLSKKEVQKYFSQVNPTYDIDSEDNKIIIDEKRYIKLGYTGNPRITLIKGKKERYLQGYVFSTPILTYMYLDRKNEKLYFAGSGVKEIGNRYEATRGILIYDIEDGKVNNFAITSEVRDIDVVENYEKFKTRDYVYYLNPIRVPNTSYLLFFIEKRADNKYFYEIAIKEVPEWKAEIEQQEKNKKENPQAKTAYTNGIVNVRDNPKGKIISTLNDWTEVLILEQKNDWYHILYADINGWTYKDNIRELEKRKN